MEAAKQVHNIPPLYDENSRILVLGSFPSIASREAAFFYGHPQNRYWKVMPTLLGEPLPETVNMLSFSERTLDICFAVATGDRPDADHLLPGSGNENQGAVRKQLDPGPVRRFGSDCFSTLAPEGKGRVIQCLPHERRKSLDCAFIIEPCTRLSFALDPPGTVAACRKTAFHTIGRSKNDSWLA